MQSKGGLLSHLTCLVCIPYLGNFTTLKIMNLSSNCTYCNQKPMLINKKVILCLIALFYLFTMQFLVK